MILVVGNINYDILFPLDRLPGPHEKLRCDNALTGFGGSAANTAFWLAKLGADVILAGSVGRDAMGKAHLESLRDAGVDVGSVGTGAASTGTAVIFSLGAEKRMVQVPGANMEGKVDPGLAEGPALVYLSGANTAMLAGYARAAKNRGVPVLCGWHGAADRDIGRLANGFILNADEVARITGLGEAAEGIRALDSDVAAVTLPTGGCFVSRGIDVAQVKAEELEPVDRTGGGDAFAAGFLAGLEMGLAVERCGEMGNRLAAKVIMGVGARPEISIPGELKFSV